ncbi:hypothetical protein WJX75_003989 [Coccomyxa subellipsoidea]|uniref:Dynein axonemal assembly factor 5 HEAT-repeat domain-containing protein n=1 Tax=Coccomyxa subellipsoidea TaxID=248742 RepID=A0ABR2Z1D3_9CHLO
MPLTTHRQQKVRLAAVAALARSVPCGGQGMIPQLMACPDPYWVPHADFYQPSCRVNFFARLAADSAVPVRQAFLSMLATWLGAVRPGDAGTPSGYWELPNGQALTAHQAALFPYVMALLADDSPSVAGNAAACLERLGAQHLEACAQHGNLDCWEEEEEEAESQINRGSLIWRAAAAGECMHRVPEGVTQPAELKPTTIAHALLTAPFTARPSIGARMLAQAHLEELLSGISGDLLGWAPEPQTRAAKLLRVCLLCWEGTIGDHLQKLSPLLIKPQTADVNAVARSEACRAVWDAMQEGCDSAAEQQASQLRTNT